LIYFSYTSLCLAFTKEIAEKKDEIYTHLIISRSAGSLGGLEVVLGALEHSLAS
jgi:hypothetical protein